MQFVPTSNVPEVVPEADTVLGEACWTEMLTMETVHPGSLGAGGQKVFVSPFMPLVDNVRQTV